MKTLVIQSHREPLPHSWLSECVASVRRWAELEGFDYRWIGDEIFNLVPEPLLAKTAQQKVIASDLARLRQLQIVLDEGYDTAIWCDADFLVFTPQALKLGTESFALGREVWVQQSTQRGRCTLQARKKVHNAFMMFRQGQSFLDFYSDTAERLLTKHPGPYVTQFIGPKLLTALHNIIEFPVIEQAGVLSPVVISDVLAGGGDSLALFNRRSTISVAGVNLCSSSVVNGDLSDSDMLNVCAVLQESGSALFSL